MKNVDIFMFEKVTILQIIVVADFLPFFDNLVSLLHRLLIQSSIFEYVYRMPGHCEVALINFLYCIYNTGAVQLRKIEVEVRS